MSIIREDIIEIVEKAATLSEYLADNSFFENSSSNYFSNPILEYWCHTIAQGNWEIFNKRIEWDALKINNSYLRSKGNSCADKSDFPRWGETLLLVMQNASQVSLDSLNNPQKFTCLDPQNPIPFEEILVGFLELAKDQLMVSSNSSYSLLSAEAHISLERQLLRRLSSIAASTLYFEFSIFRSLKESSLMSKLDGFRSTNEKIIYRSFTEKISSDGFLGFFRQYSVLARLLATVTNLWIETNVDFLNHLHLDWEAIEEKFNQESSINSNQPLQQVISLNPSLSDMHRGGKTVMAVTFNSGLQLIYKPKNLSLEAIYFKLLKWLENEVIDIDLLDLKVIKVLDRQTHGWVEYVEYHPCKDYLEVQRYYQRVGILLCLIYILGGTDFHHENLIACGEHPVLIDLETVMQPQVKYTQQTKNFTKSQITANQKLDRSVLRSGLLPNLRQGIDEESVYDLSGLSIIDQQTLPVNSPEWYGANTDRMQLKFANRKISVKTNQPHQMGENPCLSDYEDNIVYGFQQFYICLMDHKDKLLAENSPLLDLSHQSIRFLFRPTKVYSSILTKTFQPKFLQHGYDFSIQLELLTRAFLSYEKKPLFWELLNQEIKAMQQPDIPVFFCQL